ncbi:DUF1877 family protein [Xanthocytophaga flava]|uniref:DUF1877 family protein n=1 Tax=Xanthocytophaga flava TaxID=3048013 RepID=UPI0028D67E47|nr:DUF1877 family protein [Xanthocytophaga flavus]MDJ1468968.1 DUF1877 family protein [Xanthocytophaga flavus]
MSMNLQLKAIKDSDIKDLIASPILIEILENEQIDPECVDVEEKYGILPEDIADYSSWQPQEKVDKLDLEGAFVSLDYLLTGRNKSRAHYPYNFLTANHRIVTEMGWGPVNVYHSEEVKEIANALESLEESILIEEFDPQHYIEQKIYPRHYKWQKDDIYSMLNQLKTITSFLKKAVNDGKGMYTLVV